MTEYSLMTKTNKFKQNENQRNNSAKVQKDKCTDK